MSAIFALKRNFDFQGMVQRRIFGTKAMENCSVVHQSFCYVIGGQMIGNILHFSHSSRLLGTCISRISDSYYGV